MEYSRNNSIISSAAVCSRRFKNTRTSVLLAHTQSPFDDGDDDEMKTLRILNVAFGFFMHTCVCVKQPKAHAWKPSDMSVFPLSLDICYSFQKQKKTLVSAVSWVKMERNLIWWIFHSHLPRACSSAKLPTVCRHIDMFMLMDERSEFIFEGKSTTRTASAAAKGHTIGDC